MQLAYVTVPGRGMIDELIAEMVDALETDGVRLAGTVRAHAVDPRAHPCDMDLRVLPDGPRLRISQPLGAGARGCRLDGGVIEDIAVAVEARVDHADLLVVNKFGKQEALGRGLQPAITAAIEMDLPVLIGVNRMNLPDFQAFSTGLAVPLRPELRAIRAWFERARAPQALATV